MEWMKRHRQELERMGWQVPRPPDTRSKLEKMMDLSVNRLLNSLDSPRKLPEGERDLMVRALEGKLKLGDHSDWMRQNRDALKGLGIKVPRGKIEMDEPAGPKPPPGADPADPDYQIDRDAHMLVQEKIKAERMETMHIRKKTTVHGY